MNDTAPQTAITDDAATNRPSIALTTPFLSLAAAVIALAAFLLGYVVKDIAADHNGPRVSIARMHGPAGLEHGRSDGPAQFGRGDRQAMPALPERALDNVTAGTVTSVDGNTLTLTSPNGKTVKVTLNKDAFVVVRKAQK